jgi:hypothetical protein
VPGTCEPCSERPASIFLVTGCVAALNQR